MNTVKAIAFSLLLTCGAGSAFAQLPLYDGPTTPPVQITLPASPSGADIKLAQGNFDRWLKAEKDRRGPCETDEQLAARRAAWKTPPGLREQIRSWPEKFCPQQPSLEGYFALYPGDADAALKPGAIVRAKWNGYYIDDAELISGFCATDIKTAPRASFAPDQLVYLGPNLNSAWAAAGREIAGASATRAVTIAKPLDASEHRKELTQFYPPRALAREKNGRATLLCALNEGQPATCVVGVEAPSGLGFGEAALQAISIVPPEVEDKDRALASSRCFSVPVAFGVMPR